MLIYQPEQAIDDSSLVDLGAPSDLGGRVLEGDPKISARIDYQANGMTAGIFEATTGKVEINFPFTEHATIVEGEVIITDEDGKTHTYKPGDTYFIKQGQVVIWDVRGPRVRKSFFNIAHS
jgi:uncharacterized cupin superfamily protein